MELFLIFLYFLYRTQIEIIKRVHWLRYLLLHLANLPARFARIIVSRVIIS